MKNGSFKITGFVWVDKGAPPTSFPKPDHHPKAVVRALWWCCKDVIHYSFSQPGHAVTAESCCCDLDESMRFCKNCGWQWWMKKGRSCCLKVTHLTNHSAKIDPFRYRSSPSSSIFPTLPPLTTPFSELLVLICVRNISLIWPMLNVVSLTWLIHVLSVFIAKGEIHYPLAGKIILILVVCTSIDKVVVKLSSSSLKYAICFGD